MFPSQIFDILVVGAGFAGLSTATGAARNAHTVLVFDSQEYRNARSPEIHQLPTWDGKSVFEHHRAAREELLRNYDTISFKDTKIERVRQTADGGFEAVDAEGITWKGKSIVLATGVEDVPLEIPGFAECWGIRIFHCLFCHGFEERGPFSSGILAVDEAAFLPTTLHMARNALQLTKEVTIYTHGNEKVRRELEAAVGNGKAAISFDSRVITSFSMPPAKSHITLTFEDGTSKDEAFIAAKPKTVLRSKNLVEDLGLELTPQGDIKNTPPLGETSVIGCFAAGDTANQFKSIPGAILGGSSAAAGAASHVQSRLYGHKSLGDYLKEFERVKGGNEV